ncbi:MAG: peptidoglycan DD-metalloendopeptidase family protein [Alteromonas sp.]
MIAFESFEFADVVRLPADYAVLDMSNGPMELPEATEYAIGKYNEHRPDIYNAGQYQGVRDNHIGIDIFAPENTEISSFYDGVISQRAYNDLPLDYGHTLIVEYNLGGNNLFALYGHLSKASYEQNPPGKKIKRGEVFAWMGKPEENGGWPVHLHLQLSYESPDVCDMPGVVSAEDLPQMLTKYPDPQLVLGKLY